MPLKLKEFLINWQDKFVKIWKSMEQVLLTMEKKHGI